MSSAMGSIHVTPATNRWITPRWILDALGHFDLDPCADIEQPWPTATEMWTAGGLEREWHGGVWLNPPYGRETRAWLAKMANHGRGVALVFARTDTAMFHESVFGRASGMLFLKGRPKFHRPDGSTEGTSGGPLVLISYGPANRIRLASAEIPGALVTP